MDRNHALLASFWLPPRRAVARWYGCGDHLRRRGAASWLNGRRYRRTRYDQCIGRGVGTHGRSLAVLVIDRFEESPAFCSEKCCFRYNGAPYFPTVLGEGSTGVGSR